MENIVRPGLEGVVAATTRLSSVDGEAGELIIAGFPLEELALKSSFEETVYLLWNDALPTAAQLAEFRAALKARRALHPVVYALLREAAAQKADPMDALRMAASAGTLQRDGAGGKSDAYNDALSMVAKFPTIVAAYWRLRSGKEPVEPRADLDHAANYLYMLFGAEPSASQVRGLETYLNTVSDHGLNASTFTARVIMSTQSDVISAVVGAIGALKGPLHGGAPGPALDMVFEIGRVENAEPWLKTKLAKGDRLMGFGHRVYKVRDPRAAVLSAAAEIMFKSGGGDMALYNLAREIETIAVRVLEEHKPGRKLQTNVEYYTALLLHGLGLSTDVFTPTFAVGRVGGWTAHCFEQQKETRIFRPQSLYSGVKTRTWTPVEKR